jgi:hypothetical protein
MMVWAGFFPVSDAGCIENLVFLFMFRDISGTKVRGSWSPRVGVMLGLGLVLGITC